MVQNILKNLFLNTFNEEVTSITKLPSSGSVRIYYRLLSQSKTAIGAYNEDTKENEAFFSFTQSFKNTGIKVPEIYAVEENRQVYLIQDLGSTTVADYFIQQSKSTNNFDRIPILKTILKDLISIQTIAEENMDYSKCYPCQNFNEQSGRWDLNYFKYSFLKLADIPFDEQKLEDDFDSLLQAIFKTQESYFMYRDFQLRNIMWHQNMAWFIDYQGGRKGPLQYDVASLLYSPTTALDSKQREELLHFYMSELNNATTFNKSLFYSNFQLIALIRRLQAMGAYGYRGLYQSKPGFRSGVHTAISDIQNLLHKSKNTIELPELQRIFNHLSNSVWSKPYVLPANKLTINIVSFSYKRGIPNDPSENGGGFVFDCRGIPNPGRYVEYRTQSGLDEAVINYLEQYAEVHQFAENLKKVVSIPIENYIQRHFNHLCIYFGCTGGQHRSVYNAERMFKWISETYPVNVQISHREQNHWK